ncbi:hypothetical protein [Streptomyces sp. TRM49041]|uniref:hypothetical protein n=1 Tax=Streptomyces sp. TRM49041 TaxID=2603216 RepID=UPI0011EF66EB|nr:hypothetical protein [Streptomyces sp. TRM49041]
MRLRSTAALAAGAAVSTLVVVMAPALAHAARPHDVTVAGREPTCGDTKAAAFPIRTRIKGGPATYRPGAAPQVWHVELTNTTAQPCRNIHPVIVLTDRAGTLTPAQVRLNFSTTAGAGHRPVRIEHTDQNELVGVLDDDTDNAFAGFTVPARGTVPVPVSLGFTAAARPDEVTARAAIVQRRGDDGDWVGESAAYRFALAVPDVPPTPNPTPLTPTPTPPTPPPTPPGIFPEELASTGRRAAANIVPLTAAAGASLAVGAAALLLTRRLRRRP